MDDLRFLLLYGVLAGVLFASFRKRVYDRKVANVPIVGSSGFLASCWDGFRFIHRAPEFIQRGYDLYPEGVFRVARLFRWEYVVCGPKLIKDIAGAPEHVVSFTEGIEEFTMGREISANNYHLDVVRTSLTRNLHNCFPDVRDEIICAFDEVLQLQGSEWKSHPVLPTMMAIVARVSNRLFVGLPLCRDKAYLANNVAYTIDVIRSANKIVLLPPFLRPIFGPLISSKNKSNAKAMKILGPLIEERLAKEEELGSDWPGRPNDFISWMLNLAEGDQRAVLPLTLRILSINMAAIHTSSIAFTWALFDLTTYPEYFLPMREEVEHVVAEEGWSKAALNSMVKIDSFLRESQRINTNGSLGMTRKVIAKEGFRFSDGTVLPCGSYLSVATRHTHYDDSNYENAAKFDGFRFARERAEHQANHESNDSQDVFKRQMISTGVDHLPFGTGKHACPGRFFAATELKAMMAHLVLNYDVKPEVEGVRPADMIFGQRFSPNPAGRVRFRKRQ
ncbi:cytochrome P450 [Mycena sanguinolenta]|nr:cytochrome P450 [Mycena sanguinolenta]